MPRIQIFWVRIAAPRCGGGRWLPVTIPPSACSADTSLYTREALGGEEGALCSYCIPALRGWRKWGRRFGRIHNCNWTGNEIQYIVQNDTYFPPLVVWFVILSERVVVSPSVTAIAVPPPSAEGGFGCVEFEELTIKRMLPRRRI